MLRGIDESKRLRVERVLATDRARIQASDLAGRIATTWTELKRQLISADFLIPGPILRALHPTAGRVADR